ncbi:DUF4296 domain-containing protein [Bacteroidota bacterium]
MRYLISIVLFILFISCDTARRNEGLIPRDDFIQIIVEMHIIEGLFQTRQVREQFNQKYYTFYIDDYFESKKYTREQFEKTIEYYAENFVEYNLIYDKVIEELSKLEALNDQYKLPDGGNLWQQQHAYHFPEDGKRYKIPFSIPVKGKGEYIISAKFKISRLDESINPHLAAFFWYMDSTGSGIASDTTRQELKNDNIIRQSTLKLKLEDTLVNHLKGWLFYDDNTDTSYQKVGDINDIKITFIEKD